ncbi:ModE family transcriptional regulator [Acidovorax carolinensis]|uniref:ModE family transcriptional regulator n=1 Tax=Acidovorax carolinensis TaxID=553814 RepID=A0A240UC03_9BURK|nr:TOBE domain-containing protein [Acidovorax carolinensis]ART55539.1 ModE family transcriptional regulator [Acidovorax carolinensis]ART58615.1 ModE family transcriptional regulator [Acidovorax carolinensis]
MNESHPLQLDAALGHDATDKRIDVLRRIGAAGSISEAARGAGISYKAAWQAIETLGNLTGTPLVEKAVGGSGGGGAQLTPAGHRVLRAFDLFVAARQAVMAQLDDEDGVSVPSLGLAALGLRTSMRNQLPCVVADMRTSGAAVRVELALSDGTRLSSRITQESAQLLDLTKGRDVLALCKATAVSVSCGDSGPVSTNTLGGRVVRVSGDTGAAEVSLKLDCGLSMVGFASDAGELNVGDACVAHIDDSSVVIALAG